MIKKIMKPYFLLSALSLPVCFSGFATTYIDTEAQSSWLGLGVDSISGKTKTACVTGDWTEYDNNSMNFSFQNKSSISQSLRNFAGTGSASVNLGLFGGGVSVSLHSSMVENENAVTVVLRVNYVGKTVSLENRSYTALGQSMIGQPNSTIVDNCGDEYIDYLKYGNDLYFVSQMVFNSKEEYRKFVAKVKVRVLFFKTTITRTDEFYDYAQNGRYSIKALSSGQLPQYISDQLGGSNEIHCSPQDANSMAACDTAGANILDYLLSDTGYKDWVANEANHDITYYKSSRYDKTGHRELADVFVPNIDDWLSLNKELNRLLEKQKINLNIFNSYAEVPVSGQADAATIRSQIYTNISRLEQAQTTCNNEYEGSRNIAVCETAIDDAKALLYWIEL